MEKPVCIRVFVTPAFITAFLIALIVFGSMSKAEGSLVGPEGELIIQESTPTSNENITNTSNDGGTSVTSQETCEPSVFNNCQGQVCGQVKWTDPAGEKWSCYKKDNSCAVPEGAKECTPFDVLAAKKAAENYESGASNEPVTYEPPGGNGAGGDGSVDQALNEAFGTDQNANQNTILPTETNANSSVSEIDQLAVEQAAEEQGITPISSGGKIQDRLPGYNGPSSPSGEGFNTTFAEKVLSSGEISSLFSPSQALDLYGPSSQGLTSGLTSSLSPLPKGDFLGGTSGFSNFSGLSGGITADPFSTSLSSPSLSGGFSSLDFGAPELSFASLQPEGLSYDYTLGSGSALQKLAGSDFSALQSQYDTFGLNTNLASLGDYPTFQNLTVEKAIMEAGYLSRVASGDFVSETEWENAIGVKVSPPTSDGVPGTRFVEGIPDNFFITSANIKDPLGDALSVFSDQGVQRVIGIASQPFNTGLNRLAEGVSAVYASVATNVSNAFGELKSFAGRLFVTNTNELGVGTIGSGSNGSGVEFEPINPTQGFGGVDQINYSDPEYPVVGNLGAKQTPIDSFQIVPPGEKVPVPTLRPGIPADSATAGSDTTARGLDGGTSATTDTNTKDTNANVFANGQQKIPANQVPTPAPSKPSIVERVVTGTVDAVKSVAQGSAQAIQGVLSQLVNTLLGGGDAQGSQQDSGGSQQEPSAPQTGVQTPRFACSQKAIVIDGNATITARWTCFDATISRGIGFDTGGPASGEVQFIDEGVGESDTVLTYGVECISGGKVVSERTCTVPAIRPEVEVVVEPPTVIAGESVRIIWAAVGTLDDCALYAPPSTLVYTGGRADAAETPAVESSSEFAVACWTAANAPIIEKVVVSVEGDTRNPITVDVPEITASSENDIGSGVSVNVVDTGASGDSTGSSGNAATQNKNNSGTFTATDTSGNAVQLCDPSLGITKFTACLLRSSF